jgi:hypothetical protein
MKGNLVS